MTWDTIWQILRYILIAVGSFVVSKGWFSDEMVQSTIGAVGTIGAVIWGIYVKANTKAVPIATANRPDVPTVSGATGKVTP